MDNPSLAPERAPVPRHNQTLDYEGLRAEAADAFAGGGMKQSDLAAEFGISQAAISQALSRSGSKYAALQIRIIARFTDYTVQDETTPTFRVLRKA